MVHFTQTYQLLTTDNDSMPVHIKVRCAGEDKGDKGPYKANTGALKYALIQTFLLSTTDDPENDKGESQPEPKPLSRREDYLPPSTDPGEPDDVPFNDDEPVIHGKLLFVSEKSGTNKRGKWTCYGLKVDDEWYNTFSRTIGELAKNCKGQEVDLIVKKNDNGKWDIVSLNGIMHG